MNAGLAQQHLARSDQHAKTAAACGAGGSIFEWEIVMRFYAALHMVDAYFATKGTTIVATNHSERAAAIKRLPELTTGRGAQFRTWYNRLRDVSEHVRYEPDFIAQQTHVDQARKDLNSVDSYLRGKITAVLPKPPPTTPPPPPPPPSP